MTEETYPLFTAERSDGRGAEYGQLSIKVVCEYAQSYRLSWQCNREGDNRTWYAYSVHIEGRDVLPQIAHYKRLVRGIDTYNDPTPGELVARLVKGKAVYRMYDGRLGRHVDTMAPADWQKYGNVHKGCSYYHVIEMAHSDSHAQEVLFRAWSGTLSAHNGRDEFAQWVLDGQPVESVSSWGTIKETDYWTLEQKLESLQERQELIAA